MSACHLTASGRLLRLEGQFLRPHRLTVLLALAGMLVQSLLLLPVPLLQGWVVDKLVSLSSISPENIATLTRLVLAALAVSVVCYVGRLALAFTVATTMSRVSLEVVRALTDAMHRKIQRQPVSYFDREQTGRLIARITSDVGSLLIFLNSASLQLVSDLVLAAGIAATLVWLQWQLALVSFAVVPLYAVNHRLFADRIHQLSAAVRGHVLALYGLLSERVSAVRVVRSFAREEAEVGELDRHIDAHRALGWACLRTGAWQGALAVLVGGIGTVAVLGYGVLLVSWGTLSLGALLAFYALIGLLYNPIARLTQFQGTAAATRVAVERIAEVLDEPEPQADPPGAAPVRSPRGALTFRNVSFSYRAGGPPVLDGIDLHVEPGTTVGILGASGAGKSTLLALAPRLYEVAEGCGAVLLDGRDVRGLRLADLRRAVVLVPQQAWLFDGTIRANLTYANPRAAAAAVRRALEAAGLAEMVEALPRGLETPIGERGLSLSGGQRQRLALARALIADPAVLLLDDCTSALDAETEARVRAALADFLPGRTCLVVSHKVAAVRHADRILVLDRGRVAEEGGHAELLGRNGLYAEMYHQQAQLLPT